LNPSRLEIHIPFESIPNERRNQVTLGVKCAHSLVANFFGSEKTYDTLVGLQFQFINDIVSLPTINKYLVPLLS